VKVERWPSTGSPFAILENEFNGLNWRIRRKMDLSQGAYNGVDEERLYFFTPFWQMVEEWVDDDLDSAVEYRAQQFWGVRHIDDAVARRLDRDNDGAWTTDAEDNWYYLTDVMFSVRGITDNDGQIHTRVDYTPYGVAMHRYAADLNGDGLINYTDITTFNSNAGSGLEPGDTGYDPDADLNGDGFAEDYLTAEWPLFYDTRYTPYSTGGSNPMVNAGWIDNPTDPNGPDNSIAYDGYHFDLAGAADATSTGLYMVRHRVHDPGMGRWVERDPLEYTEGSNLFQYTSSTPLMLSDPMGLRGHTNPRDVDWAGNGANYREESWDLSTAKCDPWDIGTNIERSVAEVNVCKPWSLKIVFIGTRPVTSSYSVPDSGDLLLSGSGRKKWRPMTSVSEYSLHEGMACRIRYRIKFNCKRECLACVQTRDVMYDSQGFVTHESTGSDLETKVQQCSFTEDLVRHGRLARGGSASMGGWTSLYYCQTNGPEIREHLKDIGGQLCSQHCEMTGSQRRVYSFRNNKWRNLD